MLCILLTPAHCLYMIPATACKEILPRVSAGHVWGNTHNDTAPVHGINGYMNILYRHQYKWVYDAQAVMLHHNTECVHVHCTQKDRLAIILWWSISCMPVAFGAISLHIQGKSYIPTSAWNCSFKWIVITLIDSLRLLVATIVLLPYKPFAVTT